MSLPSMEERTEPDALPDQLRAATRQKHHSLNTQIITRLPLCLPPHADSPFTYAKGMVVFGQIYLAFESFLTTHLDSLDPRMTEIYQIIHLPQLLRTSRLQSDITLLKSRMSPDEAEGLEALEKQSRVISRRIDASLAARPAVLLAYTWTMYLALFNGGKRIRKQLIASGSEFWLGESLPLSFWEFGDQGRLVVEDEQLKNTFKDGYLEAAAKLTRDERQGVVEEAVRVFDLCREMVELLDRETIDKE